MSMTIAPFLFAELKEEVNVFLRFVASLPLVLPVLPRECVVILREMRLKHRVRRGAAS